MLGLQAHDLHAAITTIRQLHGVLGGLGLNPCLRFTVGRPLGGQLVRLVIFIETDGMLEAKQNDCGHGGRPASNNSSISQLIEELHAVSVESTILASLVDFSRREKASEKSTKETSEAVRAENEQRVIDNLEVSIFSPHLEHTVREQGRDDAHDDGVTRENVAACRCDGNKTYDGTINCALKCGAAGDTKVHQSPSQHSSARTDLSVHKSDTGNMVSTEGRSAVETKPAKPEKSSTQQVKSHGLCVVGFEKNPVDVTTPNKLGGDESRKTTSNVHNGTSGKVKSSKIMQPTGGAPHPVGNEIIDKDRPQ
eukprot:Colp12_sorted_trinity150504_noHs@9432